MDCVPLNHLQTSIFQLVTQDIVILSDRSEGIKSLQYDIAEFVLAGRIKIVYNAIDCIDLFLRKTRPTTFLIADALWTYLNPGRLSLTHGGNNDHRFMSQSCIVAAMERNRREPFNFNGRPLKSIVLNCERFYLMATGEEKSSLTDFIYFHNGLITTDLCMATFIILSSQNSQGSVDHQQALIKARSRPSVRIKGNSWRNRILNGSETNWNFLEEEDALLFESISFYICPGLALTRPDIFITIQRLGGTIIGLPDSTSVNLVSTLDMELDKLVYFELINGCMFTCVSYDWIYESIKNKKIVCMTTYTKTFWRVSIPA